MTLNLIYLVSHPIQYQAPLLRLLGSDPEIDLTVLFESDFSENRYFDRGFGADVEWDVPLRQGYHSHLLNEVDFAQMLEAADALWVHGWQTRTMRRAISKAFSAGRPVLMRGENWFGAMPDGPPPRAWVKRLYLKHIFSKCQSFLTVGTKNREYYLANGISEDRLFSMPYAVDNDYFASRATGDAVSNVRAQLGMEENQKMILFAGKLIGRKHPEILLEAWRRASWPVGPAPILVFTGDGEMRGALETSAPENVKFTGFKNQSELPGFYAAADLFVLMAEREPWGLAVNEAMASGTGVIVSDQVGAGFDLVTPKTGVQLPVGDVAGLASALAACLEKSDELGRAAKAKISEWDFSSDIAGLKAALDRPL